MALIFGEDEQLEGHLNRAARFLSHKYYYLIAKDTCAKGVKFGLLNGLN